MCFLGMRVSRTHTIYAVYLANNNFGELGRNSRWQTFSMANRAILIRDYKKGPKLTIKAKVAKPSH